MRRKTPTGFEKKNQEWCVAFLSGSVGISMPIGNDGFGIKLGFWQGVRYFHYFEKNQKNDLRPDLAHS